MGLLTQICVIFFRVPCFCLPQQKDIIMCATGGPGKNFKFETGSILYMHKLKKGYGAWGMPLCCPCGIFLFKYLRGG